MLFSKEGTILIKKIYECKGYNAISIRLAAVAFQIARNSKTIRTYSSSRSSKVIDLCVNRKPMYDFLLVIDSNFGRISSYRFRDIVV